jgi:hypothetical protein
MIQKKISTIELKSIDPSMQTMSRSGKRYTRSLMRQYWRISVTWVKMKNRDAQELYAHLVDMQGSHGTSSLSLPLAGEHPNVSGTAAVIGTVLAGAKMVSTAGATGSFTVGGVFNFSGHSKLYMVVSQDGGALSFTPPLRKSVNNDTINYSTPTVQVYRTKQDTAWKQQRINSQLTDEFEEELD